MVRRFDFPFDKPKNRRNGSLKKSLLGQKVNITLLKKCARKLKIRLKGFNTNSHLELYFDVYKNDCNICYVYKGWEDSGFRIANIIELNKHVPDFKERFYEIFKICSSRLITMAVQEQNKEPLSITLEIGIYKSGFNTEVFRETVEELEGCLAEVRSIL